MDFSSRSTPVGAVSHVASQDTRRVDARSSPRPDGVWGEKNVPVVSHHGYVRARRTRPGWSSGASWDAASTEVERELKSTRTFVRVAGAAVVGWSTEIQLQIKAIISVGPSYKN